MSGNKEAIGAPWSKRIRAYPPSHHADCAEPGGSEFGFFRVLLSCSRCICKIKIALVWWCLVNSVCYMRKSDKRITVICNK